MFIDFFVFRSSNRAYARTLFVLFDSFNRSLCISELFMFCMRKYFTKSSSAVLRQYIAAAAFHLANKDIFCYQAVNI